MRTFQDVDESVSLSLAMGEKLEWENEMKARQSQHRMIEFDVKEFMEYIVVDVGIDGESYSARIPRSISSANEFAEPFGIVNFQNIELSNVTIRNDSEYCEEYIEAVYWGEPQNVNTDSFVKENVRILRQEYIPREEKHNLPKYALSGAEDGCSSFDTTDVRTYTNSGKPNPWCRGSLCVLYVDEDVCRRILEHKSSSIEDWRFCHRTPYVGKN